MYCITGTITVEASGYWFTAGAEKSKFGFTPHLKNGMLPVYPDTLIKGNFRDASLWLDTITAEKNTEKFFGKENGTGGCVFFNDLELSEKLNRNIFCLQNIIQINEETNTPKDKHLGFIETAWLDGLKLESKYFAGYFETKEGCDCFINHMNKLVKLIPGFGGMRSSGNGRGQISNSCDVHCFSEPEPVCDSDYCTYELTAFTHYRSRPIHTYQKQMVGGTPFITSKQVTAWFAKTYHILYKQWPSVEEMKCLRVSNLYPSAELAAYPSPVTILKDDEGNIKDMFNTDGKDEKNSFFTSKTKSISGSYITENFDVITPETCIRMRNRMQDYMTVENGLFSQEFICKNTVFRGVVDLSCAEAEFKKRAKGILSGVMPVINGSVLRQSLKNAEKECNENSVYNLLVHEYAFSPEYADGNNLLKIGTSRTYNTMLKRPRRPKIVIEAGSVLKKPISGYTRRWSPECKAAASPAAAETSYNKTAKLTKHYNLTKSQAGVLVGLMSFSKEHAAKFLEHKIKLLDDKNIENSAAEGLIPKELLKELLGHLKESEEAFRLKIRETVRGVKIREYDKKFETVK